MNAGKKEAFFFLLLLAVSDTGSHLCLHMEGTCLRVKIPQRKIEPKDGERGGQFLAFLKAISPLD